MEMARAHLIDRARPLPYSRGHSKRTYSQVSIIFWWVQAMLTCSATNEASLKRPGSPLSEEEYEQFIKLIQPEWKAKQLCEIRNASGCGDPQVLGYDLVENHGRIPEGPVCTELDTYPHFSSFCKFAMFRCKEKQFYVKRILCSDQLLDLSNFSEDMIRPLGPHASSSHVNKGRRVLDKKKVVEQLSSRLHSLTQNLLVFSFTVCDQKPVRRIQKNLPKSLGALKNPSKIKGTFTITDQEWNNVKENLDEKVLQPELNYAAIPDNEEKLSDYSKGEETTSARSHFKPKKYMSAVPFHVKGESPNITAVSYHHHERKTP